MTKFLQPHIMRRVIGSSDAPLIESNIAGEAVNNAAKLKLALETYGHLDAGPFRASYDLAFTQPNMATRPLVSIEGNGSQTFRALEANYGNSQNISIGSATQYGNGAVMFSFEGTVANNNTPTAAITWGGDAYLRGIKILGPTIVAAGYWNNVVCGRFLDHLFVEDCDIAGWTGGARIAATAVRYGGSISRNALHDGSVAVSVSPATAAPIGIIIDAGKPTNGTIPIGSCADFIFEDNKITDLVDTSAAKTSYGLLANQVSNNLHIKGGLLRNVGSGIYLQGTNNIVDGSIVINCPVGITILGNALVSNVDVSGARRADGKGAGIYWAGSTIPSAVPEAYSQVGPFHIDDCDRGFEVRAQYLRGSGFIRGCTTAIYFDNQTTAARTELDIYYDSNTNYVGGDISNINYLSRTIKLNTVGKIPHVEILKCLNDLAARGGGELLVSDTHVLTGGVSKRDFGDVQISIRGQHNFPTFKAQTSGAPNAPGIPSAGNALIDLYPLVVNTGKLFINNLEIDCSAGGDMYLLGRNTAGLSLHNWETAHLYDFGGPGGDGTTGAISYDGRIGSTMFTIGRTLNGVTSGAHGIITDGPTGPPGVGLKPESVAGSGRLGVKTVTGIFLDGEALTETPAGATGATVAGMLTGNLTGDQLLSTVSIYDFLWDGGFVRYWSDMALYPGGDSSRDGLPFDTQTQDFTLGDLIIGSASSATGTLAFQLDIGTIGTLFLNNIRGQFKTGETITGLSPTGISRGSARAAGPWEGQLGDGFVLNVRNLVVEHCTNGIAFKREGYSLHVDGCTFRFCGGGVTTAETGAPFVGSGRSLVVSNCNFFNTTNTGAPLRCKGDTRVFYHNNLIRDWGRLDNGDAARAGQVWAAVNIQGPRDFVVCDNVFEMINWNASNGHVGIRVEKFIGANEIPAGETGLQSYSTKTGTFVVGDTLTATLAGVTKATARLEWQKATATTTGSFYLSKVTGVAGGVLAAGQTLTGALGGSALTVGALTAVPSQSTTHTPFGGTTHGNTYRNIPYGIREDLTGTNTYLDEYMDNVWVEPVFPISGGTLNWDAQTQDFTNGIVAGVTSGASARIVANVDNGATGTLTLQDIIGTFQDNELIKGVSATSGPIQGSATVNGTLTTTGFNVGSRATYIRQGASIPGAVGYALSFQGQTGNFTIDQTVTGATSGAHGVIYSQIDKYSTGTLFLKSVVGTFIANETITDPLGGSAQAILGVFPSIDNAAIRYERFGPILRKLDNDGVFVYTSTNSGTIDPGSTPTLIQLAGAISGNRILTINQTNTGIGSRFHIFRIGLGAANWNIRSEAMPTGVYITSLDVNTWCDVVFDGLVWRVAQKGPLI